MHRCAEEYKQKISALSLEQCCEIYDTLNGWQWPNLLGPKPEKWDRGNTKEIFRYKERTIAPIMDQIRAKVMAIPEKPRTMDAQHEEIYKQIITHAVWLDTVSEKRRSQRLFIAINLLIIAVCLARVFTR